MVPPYERPEGRGVSYQRPRRPGSGIISGVHCSGRISTSAAFPVTVVTASFTCWMICGAYGQKGVVSSIRTTFGSTLWSISRTSPSSMMLRLISGSTTCSKAALISSSVAMRDLVVWPGGAACRRNGAPLVREPDVKLVPLDAHRVGFDRRHGRKRERGTRLDVEPRAV